MLRPQPPFKLYRGIIPSWDNTARRQDSSTIIINATPQFFGSWLKFLRAYTRETRPGASDPFIFVNAWNEWGEGNYVEPDTKYSHGFLDAIRNTIKK